MYRRDDVFWAVCHGAVLTNDAKDAQNVGSEYHQHVDEGEKNDSDGNVTQPVERLGGEQHLLDGSAYLQKETEGGGFSDNTDNTTIRYLASGGDQPQTYREQHNRDGQRHSSEDGYTHTQDQSVIWVDPAVSVQQLRLHIVYRNEGRKRHY